MANTIKMLEAVRKDLLADNVHKNPLPVYEGMAQKLEIIIRELKRDGLQPEKPSTTEEFKENMKKVKTPKGK